MKKSELRKLTSQYKEILQKQKKKKHNGQKLLEKLKEIEHRYFHETGRTLKSDFKELK